eukprot:5106992-Ditylum_brightwellii.AAC.1
MAHLVRNNPLNKQRLAALKHSTAEKQILLDIDNVCCDDNNIKRTDAKDNSDNINASNTVIQVLNL